MARGTTSELATETLRTISQLVASRLDVIHLQENEAVLVAVPAALYAAHERNALPRIVVPAVKVHLGELGHASVLLEVPELVFEGASTPNSRVHRLLLHHTSFQESAEVEAQPVVYLVSSEPHKISVLLNTRHARGVEIRERYDERSELQGR